MQERQQDFYKTFLKQLEDENRLACVNLALHVLEKGEIDIPELYSEVLAPALNSIGNEKHSQEIRIWKEHVRSSIVRTVIENCFPYVMKERESKGIPALTDKVIVLCPDGETHELGARMAADFFALQGYDVVFIGGSTPKEEFLDVLDVLKPKYIAISVTNYYNLVAARKTIAAIRGKTPSGFRILAGGHAFHSSREMARSIGADDLIDSYEDICSLGKEAQ